MLSLITSLFLIGGISAQHAFDLTRHDSDSYCIDSISIYYESHPAFLTLGEHRSLNNFLAQNNKHITSKDESVINKLQNVISNAQKDTIEFIRYPLTIPSIDYVGNDTIACETPLLDSLGRIRYSGYWKGGPDVSFAVILNTNHGNDTLGITTNPDAYVQYNNTTFKDSTIFYTVTQLIRDNDKEWAAVTDDFYYDNKYHCLPKSLLKK